MGGGGGSCLPISRNNGKKSNAQQNNTQPLLEQEQPKRYTYDECITIVQKCQEQPGSLSPRTRNFVEQIKQKLQGTQKTAEKNILDNQSVNRDSAQSEYDNHHQNQTNQNHVIIEVGKQEQKNEHNNNSQNRSNFMQLPGAEYQPPPVFVQPPPPPPPILLKYSKLFAVLFFYPVDDLWRKEGLGLALDEDQDTGSKYRTITNLNVVMGTSKSGRKAVHALVLKERTLECEDWPVSAPKEFKHRPCVKLYHFDGLTVSADVPIVEDEIEDPRQRFTAAFYTRFFLEKCRCVWYTVHESEIDSARVNIKKVLTKPTDRNCTFRVCLLFTYESVAGAQNDDTKKRLYEQVSDLFSEIGWTFQPFGSRDYYTVSPGESLTQNGWPENQMVTFVQFFDLNAQERDKRLIAQLATDCEGTQKLVTLREMFRDFVQQNLNIIVDGYSKIASTLTARESPAGVHLALSGESQASSLNADVKSFKKVRAWSQFEFCSVQVLLKEFAKVQHILNPVSGTAEIWFERPLKDVPKVKFEQGTKQLVVRFQYAPDSADNAYRQSSGKTGRENEIVKLFFPVEFNTLPPECQFLDNQYENKQRVLVTLKQDLAQSMSSQHSLDQY